MVEQLNQILQGICNWIAARNKVLWTGSNQQGQIVIPGIDNYDLIAAEVYSYSGNALMQRTIAGHFVGFTGSGASSQVNTCCVILLKNAEDTYTVNTYAVSNISGGAHSAVSLGYGINRVIGIEPIPEKIIGGGTVSD